MPKKLGVCAECSIMFDNVLCVHKVLVIAGKKGKFIAFPNAGATNDSEHKRYKDIVHPIEKNLTDLITTKVLEAYEMHK